MPRKVKTSSSTTSSSPQTKVWSIKRPSLAVLDVGHGNAAVLLDTGGVIVIDAGKGGLILDFLKQADISVVDVLIISHADDDHVGNAPTLLIDPEIVVKKVYYNSDPSKSTRSWLTFQRAIKLARHEKDLEAHAELTTVLTGHLDQGEIQVEILYPTPEIAASGPGGWTVDGVKLTPNSMSAAVRLSKGGEAQVLLAGDIEDDCLDVWDEEGTDPRTRILVYPHHGGNPGTTDPVEFAKKLCDRVRPEMVLFSIHRSKHELPIPEVVQAIREVIPNGRIACTQLSGHCAKQTPSVRANIHTYPARGIQFNSCCAGTFIIDLSRIPANIYPSAAEHQAFILSSAETALCQVPKQQGSPVSPPAT